MMPKIGESNAGFDKNMIPKLETKLGRKLTTDELAAIRAILNRRRYIENLVLKIQSVL